ncbi:MAG: hypothetical protein DMF71_03830 [Acidobacteria bacterium]|nr:MAG: hypothetical protein DMF71_03830 [Acidobacteriota bacterium]
MSRKKKQDVASPADSTPFFVRYLEGQSDSEAEGSARIAGRQSLGYKKAATKTGPIQTLKFPSDGDELHYYPYYASKNDLPQKPSGGGFVTLKFPSDSDEHKYVASYVAKADVPKGKAKPKTGGRVYLKKK